MTDRIYVFDEFQLDAAKVEEYDDPFFGPVTRFKDVVIMREIAHRYNDGIAWKPADELEKATRYGAMWATAGSHPVNNVITSTDEVHGRVVNPRFVKSLIDPKTKRPNNRGTIADLDIFNDFISPELLKNIKAGKSSDVSVGFFFDKDDVAGEVADGAIKGAKYDYAQRKIMLNHLAYGLDRGRCPMPYCGIGADEIFGADPFAGYASFAECVEDIMKKNPEYTRKQAEGTCAVIEQRSKEKHKSDEVKSKSMEALKQVMFIVETALEEDITEEKDGQEGEDGPRTEVERAKAHFEISDEDWEKLSDEEKQEYIDKLPERGTGGETGDEDKEWWTTYDWNANPESYYALPEEGKEALIAAGLWTVEGDTSNPETPEKPEVTDPVEPTTEEILDQSRKTLEKSMKIL